MTITWFQAFRGSVVAWLMVAALAGSSTYADIPPINGDPTVRFAYVIPSNRTPQPNGVANYQESVLLAHAGYGEQMWRWGFGNKSFRYETEDDGLTPLIHVINVPETDEYLRGDPPYGLWGRVPAAAYRAGAKSINHPGEIWVFIAEAHLQLEDGSIIGGTALGGGGALWGTGCLGDANGRAMIGSDMLPFMGRSVLQDNTPYHGLIVPEIGPYPLVYGKSWAWFLGQTKSSVASSNTGALAHEMGHAFGLYHDFRNDANFCGLLMGNGLRGFRGWLFPEEYPDDVTRLSYASAMALNSSPYFTASRQATPAAVTTTGATSAATSDDRPPRSTALRSGPTGSDIPPPIRAASEEAWGLDQEGRGDKVLPTLGVLTSGNVEPVAGHIPIRFTAGDNVGLAVALLRLKGDTVGEMPLAGTQVTETFVTPYREHPYYGPGESHEYKITVYDVSGNARNAVTYITPATGFNYAPRPYITMFPASQVHVGETVALDAWGSKDPNHSTRGLLVEWDLDGDGIFEISPTLVKTLSTSFSSKANQLIRARLTDPVGAQTVSAPIALRVVPVVSTVPGDLDCDGDADFDDIDPFVLALGGEAGYLLLYPDCRWLNADINGDGNVDFDDIDPFVGLLGG